MLIRVFPPHYQLVYINFDISSFSLISYRVIICSPPCESLLSTTGNLSLHGGEIFPFIAGICISYRKDNDKPCFIDLII